MTRATAGSRRVEEAFGAARADGRIGFVPYVVAGYPTPADSVAVAIAALDAGADVLEVGLPYSDPLADGATLQRASAAALAAGTTPAKVVDIVEQIVRRRPATPVLVMGYANQFLAPAAGSLPRRLAEAGACGAIMADLTPDEGRPLEETLGRHDMALVYLVAPSTPPERVAMIGARSGGFVYCVSLSGVTGARAALGPSVKALVGRAKRVSSLPVAVGFGVGRPAHVTEVAAAGADGVIVGSALVDALGPDGSDRKAFTDLCRMLARSTRAGSHEPAGRPA